MWSGYNHRQRGPLTSSRRMLKRGGQAGRWNVKARLAKGGPRSAYQRIGGVPTLQ
jgi:hypothetical protein